MAIMRYKDWDPFRELTNVLDWRPRLLTDWEISELRFPAVDVEEKGNAIVVKAEVPGIKPEDINIELHDNHLLIRGEKKEEREEKDEQKRYYFRERAFGSFARTISLTHEVDPEKVKADYKNGVLSVTLEKTEARKTRKIPIKTT